MIIAKYTRSPQITKEGVGTKFKEGICAEFCLKREFEGDWYFCKITESRWF